MMRLSASLGALRDTLAEPAYGRYVAGNSISLVGNWMQRTAIGWLAWDLTHSATWVGMVAFADLFPALIIGPVGGVLADRHSRRRIMFFAQSAMLVLAAVLGLLELAGMMDIHALVMLTALHGILVGINQPSRLALVPSLVSPPNLATAIALNSIVFNAARFVGPAIAGALIAGVGSGWTFIVNALTYLPFLWVLSTLVPLSHQRPATRASLLTQIGEGVRYFVDQRSARLLVLAVLAASILVRPLAELLPAIADGVFARGPVGLAMLSAGLGAGAIAGGLLVAMRITSPSLPGLARWMAAAAVVTALVGVSPWFLGALAMTTLAGTFFVISGVSAQTMIQTSVPEELRGRVMSLFGLVFRAAPATGALLLGAAADRVGIRTSLMVSSAMLLVFLLAWNHRVVRDEEPAIGR